MMKFINIIDLICIIGMFFLSLICLYFGIYFLKYEAFRPHGFLLIFIGLIMIVLSILTNFVRKKDQKNLKQLDEETKPFGEDF